MRPSPWRCRERRPASPGFATSLSHDTKSQGAAKFSPVSWDPSKMWGTDGPIGCLDMTVIAAAEYEGTIRAGTTVQRSAILDMSGPGAEISRFSSLTHLVLNFRIVPGIAELEAHTAIQLAEYKIAHRLAQTTAELSPEKIVTYELGHQDPDLPNVMLVQGCITDPQHVHSGVGYYGLSLAGFHGDVSTSQ